MAINAKRLYPDLFADVTAISAPGQSGVPADVKDAFLGIFEGNKARPVWAENVSVVRRRGDPLSAIGEHLGHVYTLREETRVGDDFADREAVGYQKPAVPEDKHRLMEILRAYTETNQKYPGQEFSDSTGSWVSLGGLERNMPRQRNPFEQPKSRKEAVGPSLRKIEDDIKGADILSPKIGPVPEGAVLSAGTDGPTPFEFPDYKPTPMPPIPEIGDLLAVSPDGSVPGWIKARRSGTRAQNIYPDLRAGEDKWIVQDALRARPVPTPEFNPVPDLTTPSIEPFAPQPEPIADPFKDDFNATL